MYALKRLAEAVALSVVLVSVIGASAFASVSAEMVQHRLRAKVAEKWTTANMSIKVVPYASQDRTDKGQFALISLYADAAQHKEQHIRIVDVLISARDVALDMGALLNHDQVKLRARRSGDTRVKLTEPDVNKLLTMKETPIQNLKATFGVGSITFTGHYKLNMKLTGTLVAKDGYEIYFKPTQASVGALGIPLGVVNLFLAKLNPIIDMREVPLQPSIKTISITPRFIACTGQ